jgi:hypothetical protein
MPDKDQRRRFEEMAREVGADESGEAFERAFEKVVPAKHRPPEATKTARRQSKPRK